MVFSWGSGTNVRVQGCLLTHSDVAGGNEAIRVYAPASGSSFVTDSVAFSVASPSFPTTVSGSATPSGYTQINNTTADPLYINQGARNYRLSTGSPAINLASARPQYVPSTDIDGATRATADAGCFAF